MSQHTVEHSNRQAVSYFCHVFFEIGALQRIRNRIFGRKNFQQSQNVCGDIQHSFLKNETTHTQSKKKTHTHMCIHETIKPHIQMRRRRTKVNSLSFVRIMFSSIAKECFYYENQIKSEKILAVGGRDII